MPRLDTRFLLPLLLLALAAPARAADVTVTLDAGDGFVVEDNTATIERLRVDEATGNISRNGALFVHTTGTDNTFVGDSAGSTATSGLGQNSAFGASALSSNTLGHSNSAFGDYALRSNTTGIRNSAFGKNALRYNTTGEASSAFGHDALKVNTASGNSAFGVNALESNMSGIRNSAFGASALILNRVGNGNTGVGYKTLFSNTGDGNSAFGEYALAANTGYQNSAFGKQALKYNSTGVTNAAFGNQALRHNTNASRNSAFGVAALRNNTTGARNSAFGRDALISNVLGGNNAAFGERALYNATGSNNVAMGRDAGFNQTIGSNNIYLASAGAAAESGQIKIGTAGTHTDAFVAGITGNVVAGSAVFVTASGELGVAASSARFKQNVHDMGAASDYLMRLRPVTFEYRAAVDGAADGRHYGLIAEEVAEVAPELVVYDEEGLPFSVRYHLLGPMLLNEVQKQQRVNDEQQRTIETLLARLQKLERGADDPVR